MGGSQLRLNVIPKNINDQIYRLKLYDNCRFLYQLLFTIFVFFNKFD